MAKRGLHENRVWATIAAENKGFAVRCLPLTIICLMTTALGGCATHQADSKADVTAVRMTAPAEQDILSLGRSMSDNSVDIYEPGTPSVDIPTIATFTPRVSPISENGNIIVRDNDVTVYSLEADPAAVDMPALNREPVAPAPPARRYASDLTPIAPPQGSLPNLQPPLAAQGQYASPFMAAPGTYAQ